MLCSTLLRIALILFAAVLTCRSYSYAADAIEKASVETARTALEEDAPAEAAETLGPLAADGIPEAMFMLGFLHEVGAGVMLDESAALRLLNGAAEKGQPTAARYLEWKYRTGFLVKADASEAARYAARITSSASPDSLIPEKWLRTNGQDFAPQLNKVFLWLNDAAIDEDRIAQYNLSQYFCHGHGVPVDKSLYMHWLKRAADREVAPAALQLARAYQEENILSHDEKIGYYLLIAAEAGLPDAQYEYGHFLQTAGNLDQPALTDAVRWMELAAAQNHPLANLRLGHHLATGTGVEKNLEKACDYFFTALELTDDHLFTFIFLQELKTLPEETKEPMKRVMLSRLESMAQQPAKKAERILTALLVENKDWIADRPKGVARLELRAAEKQLWALEYLCHACIMGEHLTRDFERAFDYATQAAPLPGPASKASLGVCLMLGTGCEIDEPRGLALLEAAASTSGNASYRLFEFYALGIGVPIDHQRASSFLSAAACLQHLPACALLLQNEKDAHRAVRKLGRPEKRARTISETICKQNVEAVVKARRETAAAVLWRYKPDFPPRMRLLGTNGETVIRFVVTTEGRTSELTVISTTHKDFAASAMDCIKDWRFTPRIKNGEPVATAMQLPVIFNLNDP